MLGAAVSQDGDEGLLIRAELLLSGLEEDLQEQINNVLNLVAPFKTAKAALQKNKHMKKKAC